MKIVYTSIFITFSFFIYGQYDWANDFSKGTKTNDKNSSFEKIAGDVVWVNEFENASE